MPDIRDSGREKPLFLVDLLEKFEYLDMEKRKE